MSKCTHNLKQGRNGVIFRNLPEYIDRVIVRNFTRVIGPYVFKSWRFRGISYPRTEPKMQIRVNMTPR